MWWFFRPTDGIIDSLFILNFFGLLLLRRGDGITCPRDWVVNKQVLVMHSAFSVRLLCPFVEQVTTVPRPGRGFILRNVDIGLDIFMG